MATFGEAKVLYFMNDISKCFAFYFYEYPRVYGWFSHYSLNLAFLKNRFFISFTSGKFFIFKRV